MMTKKKMLLVALWAMGALFCAALILGRGDEAVRAGVVRVHILAESDDAADQETKLFCRDLFLEWSRQNLPAATNREDAEKALAAELPILQKTVEAALVERGTPQSVSLTLGPEYYPRRDYGDFSLPAGEYSSLVVRLGKGEGKNWWCVLFPPVCLDSASAETLLTAAAGDDADVLFRRTPACRFRFFLWDTLGKWEQAWRV